MFIYLPDISWYQKDWYPNTKLKKYLPNIHHTNPPKLHCSAAVVFCGTCPQLSPKATPSDVPLPTETLSDWEGLGVGTQQLNLSNHQKCAVLPVFEGSFSLALLRISSGARSCRQLFSTSHPCRWKESLHRQRSFQNKHNPSNNKHSINDSISFSPMKSNTSTLSMGNPPVCCC